MSYSKWMHSSSISIEVAASILQKRCKDFPYGLTMCASRKYYQKIAAEQFIEGIDYKVLKYFKWTHFGFSQSEHRNLFQLLTQHNWDAKFLRTIYKNLDKQ